MEHGLTLTAMVGAGGPPWCCISQTGDLTVTTATGCTVTVVGIGFQIIHGVLRFIMAAGSIMLASVGVGCQTRFGGRHG